MPITPGVDGVLLELLLVTPRVGGGGLVARRHPNHAAPKAGPPLRGGKHRNPDSLLQEGAEGANKWCPLGSTAPWGGQTREEEEEDGLARGFFDSNSSVSVSVSTSAGRVSTGGVSSSDVDVRVGAVALLLSEVGSGDSWRTMESPLFDRADREGRVVGRIKMLARRVGVGVEGRTASNEPLKSAVCVKMEGATAAATDKPKSAARMEMEGATAATDKPESAVPEEIHHQARKRNTSTATTTSGVGLEAVAAPHSTELKEGVFSGQENQPKARKKSAGAAAASASATTCCNHGRGESIQYTSNDVSRTGEQIGRLAGSTTGTVEKPVAPVGLAVAAVATAAAAAAATNETPPRATILYRGLCLPFRWFRSSTPAAMDEALRETLGEFMGEEPASKSVHTKRDRERWAHVSRSN